ncbi:MAG: glycerol kinase GlpK [Phycisphaerales bacterium]|jgi:glycerol kinase
MPVAPAAILALDQGTTSSRAVVFEFDDGRLGRALGDARREFACTYPRPGWVEQDPMEVWRSQHEAAEAALAASGVAPTSIVGLGLTNQRETVVLWDRATGVPVAPAIVWQDRRTSGRTDRLRRDGREAWLIERTGLPCDPYFSASKIQWLLEHVPDAADRAARGELAVGTIDAWLLWNLTEGRTHATDVSNASRTQLWNLHTRSWDESLCELFGVPMGLLPEVVPSAGEAGRCRLFGGDVPILGVIGDQQSALAGQGCSVPGESKTTYGTGCFLLVQTGERVVPSGSRLLTTAAWQVGEQAMRYALEGSVFMGGALIQWLRDGLGIIEKSSEVGPLAATVEDSAGVVMVPAFTGLGAPHWDAEARGSVFGLTRGATRAHVARAALEGIAAQVADVLEAATVDLRDAELPAISRVRVDGGAAACDELMQLQADLLGLPVERPADLETTVRGAAAMVCLALGGAELADEATVERRFDPQRDDAWRSSMRDRWRDAVATTRSWAERSLEGESHGSTAGA